MMTGERPLSLIAGAAAIVILAGAMWVMAKAMQGFAKASEMFIPFLDALFEGMSKLIGAVADAFTQMLDTIAATFEKLADIDGDRLGKTAWGITEISLALAAFGGGGMLAGIGSAIGSDRKLKKNIEYKFDSPSGIPVYNFEYIDDKYGSGIHQGVMSDEVPLEAVITGPDGYDMVNYNMLDVDFKQL